MSAMVYGIFFFKRERLRHPLSRRCSTRIVRRKYNEINHNIVIVADDQVIGVFNPSDSPQLQ